MSPPSPDALTADVALAARGDRDAFGRLVQATGALVASLALAEVGDVATSEDVAQDVYHHAWRDLRTLRSPRSFLPWLRQLTRRRAGEARAGRRRLVTGPAGEATVAAAADERPGTAERLVAAEDRRLLAAALDALPAEAREVLVLYYREGRSASQVARLLELSEAAVHQRLSRARAALRADVLARAGEAAARTAPGAALAGSLLATLPEQAVAAPAAGAAAASLAKAALGVGKALAWPALTLLATVAPALGASAGLAAEVRALMEGAGEAERRALRRWRAVAIGWLLLTTAAVPLVALLAGARGPFAASFAVFSLGWTVIEGIWLPAVTPRPLRRSGAQRAAGLAAGAAVSLACAWLAWRWW